MSNTVMLPEERVEWIIKEQRDRWQPLTAREEYFFRLWFNSGISYSECLLEELRKNKLLSVKNELWNE